MTKAQETFATVQAMVRKDGGEMHRVYFGDKEVFAGCRYDAVGFAREAVFNRYSDNVRYVFPSGFEVAGVAGIGELTY